MLHSAAWDHSVALEGKRAAIVGTGASAIQIIPEIAPQLARLDVYQRTPIWVGPKLDLPTPDAVRWLFRRFPAAQEAVRRAVTDLVEAGLVGLVVHHDQFGWITRVGRLAGAPRLVSAAGPRSRRAPAADAVLRGRLQASLGFEHLPADVQPSQRGARLRADRAGGRARREDRRRPRAAESTSWSWRPGFRLATDPENYRLNPVRGRDGFDLAQFYADNHARSYESISLPGLPNHFMIFGPYGWTGGTWHQLVETASHHIIRVIEEARRRGATAVEVREDAAERWTRFARERLGRSLWALGSCQQANSYYFDHHGDTPFLRPTSAKQAWQAARSFPLDDYAYQTSDRPEGSRHERPHAVSNR